MNNIQYPILPGIFLLILTGCGVSKQNTARTEQKRNESNMITFLVLTIHRDSATSTNRVEFVSKKESTGTMKKKQVFPAGNYLSIYSYSGRQVLDSSFLEHPLYKHLEYVDENNRISVKDTVINYAEFFVRMQGHFTEIRIIENLKDKLPRQLNMVKL